MERHTTTLFRVDNYDDKGSGTFEGIFTDFEEAESTLDYTDEVDERPP